MKFNTVPRQNIDIPLVLVIIMNSASCRIYENELGFKILADKFRPVTVISYVKREKLPAILKLRNFPCYCNSKIEKRRKFSRLRRLVSRSM